jgi:hypothetical protein
MELNITAFVRDADAFKFSASIAERGQNAGPETWNNAKQEATESPLVTTEEQFATVREWLQGVGAWSREEIAAMDGIDLNALLIQFISGDLREAGLDACDPDDFDWDEYESDANEGSRSGNLYRGDDGQIYFYVGS